MSDQADRAAQRPHEATRRDDEGPAPSPRSGFQARAEALTRGLQSTICDGLEALEREFANAAAARGGEGGQSAAVPGTFRADAWTRDGGGGGLTRVMQDGVVLEKGGVAWSGVEGHFPEAFAKEIPGSGTAFFATGVSLVLHPHSPHVPTVHANFRYLEHGDKAWFGGGADLTPYYYDVDDEAHFHGVWRDVCGAYPDVADHRAFTDECDRYFFLPHRGERRGVGGIFFDYLWVGDDDEARRERVASFVEAAGKAFLDAYLPIVRRHVSDPVTEAQRHWQEHRRGRYVEFNLVYDRGTTFGLKTGGRTESILMSLPPRVRWSYMFEPEPGTPEAALLERVRRPPPPKT